jgi:dsDNA-specific endonuclease/ATPase MutS2
MDDDELDPDAVIAVPITAELDLHTFRPSETASVVEEYLLEARALGLRQVRVIHGKGTGTQREIVHAVLRRHPAVARFALAGERAGSWGATVVDLLPP